MINRTEDDIKSTWSGNYDTPLVTIRCATYNHVKYIAQSFDGFLSQVTSFPFEIIVHDDASTDGTSEIVREYSAKYPSIINAVIETENQYSKCKHESIDRVINPKIHGKYIALCEGDDYWVDERKLQKQITYMEAHPECSMTFHSMDYLIDGKIRYNDKRYRREVDVPTEKIIEGGGLYCATGSLCCKTSLYFIYPAWRIKSGVGDYPLQILMAINGKVHYFPETMGVYRYGHKGSWTRRSRSKEDIIKRLKNHIKCFEIMNKDTGHRYEISIDYIIVGYVYQLYKRRAIDLKQVKRYIDDTFPLGKKHILIRIIMKKIIRKVVRKLAVKLPGIPGGYKQVPTLH